MELADGDVCQQRGAGFGEEPGSLKGAHKEGAGNSLVKLAVGKSEAWKVHDAGWSFYITPRILPVLTRQPLPQNWAKTKEIKPAKEATA
jgi:hypothetical protein